MIVNFSEAIIDVIYDISLSSSSSDDKLRSISAVIHGYYSLLNKEKQHEANPSSPESL